MENPQTIKVNAQSTKENMNSMKKLLLEYKDMFTWTYKDLKGIPPKLAQHCIELDTSCQVQNESKLCCNC
jgi:hypothetical protein